MPHIYREVICCANQLGTLVLEIKIITVGMVFPPFIALNFIMTDLICLPLDSHNFFVGSGPALQLELFSSLIHI